MRMMTNQCLQYQLHSLLREDLVHPRDRKQEDEPARNTLQDANVAIGVQKHIPIHHVIFARMPHCALCSMLSSQLADLGSCQDLQKHTRRPLSGSPWRPLHELALCRLPSKGNGGPDVRAWGSMSMKLVVVFKRFDFAGFEQLD